MKEYECLSKELGSHIKGIEDIEAIFGEDFNFHDAEVDEILLDNYNEEAKIKLWAHCRDNGKSYRIDWNIDGFRAIEATNYDAAVNYISCCYFATADNYMKIHLDTLGFTMECKSMEIKVSEISMLDRAIEIATKAHKGQYDKGGRNYVWHAMEVMHMCEAETEKIVGVLHDVVEDTSWTFEMLEAEGFSSEVIDALRCVTKLSDDENYDAFISRVMTNPIAVQVKKNDLIHNMDLTRLDSITDKDVFRIRKYLSAYERLMAGSLPDVRVLAAACVAELQYVVNFCENKKFTSASDCQSLLSKEYRPCIESVIPRLNMIIGGDYNDSPYRWSITEHAQRSKDVIIEMLDLIDKMIDTPESDFQRSDLSGVGAFFEILISYLLPYTPKYIEIYP